MGVKYKDLGVGLKIITAVVALIAIMASSINVFSAYRTVTYNHEALSVRVDDKTDTLGSEVVRVEDRLVSYIETDLKWKEKASDKVDTVINDVNLVKVNQAEISVKYTEILRGQEELKKDFLRGRAEAQQQNVRIFEKLDNLIRAD